MGDKKARLIAGSTFDSPDAPSVFLHPSSSSSSFFLAPNSSDFDTGISITFQNILRAARRTDRRSWRERHERRGPFSICSRGKHSIRNDYHVCYSNPILLKIFASIYRHSFYTFLRNGQTAPTLNKSGDRLLSKTWTQYSSWSSLTLRPTDRSNGRSGAMRRHEA